MPIPNQYIQLRVLSESDEFLDLRFRNGEKSLYKEINKDNGLKYPIKEELSTPAHKVFIIIQVGNMINSYVKY